MNTRTFNTVLITTFMGLSGAAVASPDYHRGDAYTVRAKVVGSTPIYETISEPRRECRTETVGYETRSVRDGSNTGGAILGAIAGGLIGSTVGKGDGRVAAAAVGAATGAVVGDRMGSGPRYETLPQQVERCRTIDNFRQVVTGYDVRYRFDGREYITRLPYDPGKWLTLNVNHSMVDDRRGGRWHRNSDDWDD